MFTKVLLFAVLAAACGAQSSPATVPDEPLGGDTPTAQLPSASHPDDEAPDEIPPEESQHFCCQSVNLDKKSGEGCISIGAAQIDTCSELLYCGGDYGKSGGTTKCL
jgi:hypothetical protein